MTQVIDKMAVLKAYFQENGKVPHIELSSGKQWHDLTIETLNDEQVKFVNHKAIAIKDILCVIIPQHSCRYDNKPFCDLVCKNLLGQSYQDTKNEIKYHYNESKHLGGKHTKYLPSCPTMKEKTINGALVKGVETYGTLTDLMINDYKIGDYYSSTSSKWGSFGNGLNKIY